MAKAKKAPNAPGAPLPDHFHPKDSPNGVIARTDRGLSCVPNIFRRTVFLCTGGVTLEMTPEAAEKFLEQLRCAIDCSRGSEGKSAEDGK